MPWVSCTIKVPQDMFSGCNSETPEDITMTVGYWRAATENNRVSELYPEYSRRNTLCSLVEP